jgi:hypothetical protein
MMAKTLHGFTGRQVAAVLVMAAGWGWMNGNFGADNSIYLYNALIHAMPLVILLVLALRFFRSQAVGPTGLTVYSVVCLVLAAIGIVLGVTNPDPNAFGVKTLPDWFATLILVSGCLLWLTTLLPARSAETRVSTPYHR